MNKSEVQPFNKLIKKQVEKKVSQNKNNYVYNKIKVELTLQHHARTMNCEPI